MINKTQLTSYIKSKDITREKIIELIKPKDGNIFYDFEKRYKNWRGVPNRLGDWVLFEHVISKDKQLKITQPILGLYFNGLIYDQTCSNIFILPIRTIHENSYFNGERNQYNTMDTISEPIVYEIIEWSDFIYVLNSWSHKPNFKELREGFKESLYYKI